MATDKQDTQGQEAAEDSPGKGQTGADGFEPITSQEQLDVIIKGRLAREREKARAKYSDYDELREAAAAAEGLRGDLEAANRRAEEAEASTAALRAEAQRAEDVREVAERAGVDAGLLSLMRADTREELEEAAEAILQRAGRAPRYPAVYDGGAGGTSPVSKQDIESIKDPVRRVAARAANAGLYRNK